VSDPVDLLVLGDANPDLILSGDVDPAFGQQERIVEGARLTVGGSGAIVACGAARLGLHVVMCGVVGEDPFGRFIRDELQRRAVDVRGLVVDADRPTGVTVVLARPGDRAILTHEGTIPYLRTAQIDRGLLDSARHVHVSSYFLQHHLRPGLPELFELVRARGGTISVDPNWDPSQRWDGGLRDLLSAIDVFLPNATEAMSIAGATTAEDAAAALATRDRLVVVKAGAAGAVAAKGDEVVHASAPVANAVDATGAGDAFDAGFIAAWLAGKSLERSLAIATACGSLSTRMLGGVDAQATMGEATELAGREADR
jgi:sugar/nucleoside kinase (ribokinase family)